ncbi:LytTR family transcriptional regulator DNA-binding domain-containing protein [Streptococcus panodentis]|uniref:DNA-binding response regulator n=1 Tax=Streptococcus panodentis TaxID=1581472 RepID=A0ABS5AUW0_9STRE|nr:response regulator transcription factor [Streptococcus panodentis]MBP2620353.1 DNA-binding response regulator [Streptococcus panodentis]
MKIFVLDDDKQQQVYMETTIRRIFEKNGWEDFQLLEIYGKPEQLIDAMHERGSHQIFFLDIEIKKEAQKGLEVAQQIRKQDPYALIVFVTTHSEFLPLTFRYQVSAFDFIDKNLSDEDFAERIEQDLAYLYERRDIYQADETYIFENGHSEFQVPFNEIYYFETSEVPHKLILYTKTQRLEFYGQLSEVVDHDKRLIRCHRSFVVNPGKISSIDKDKKMVFFPNGASCYVSRYKMKGLLEAFRKVGKHG